MLISKFLDPKNDFAFKRIFGTEKNSDILIHFINDMLQFSGKSPIRTVSFLKTTHDPEIASKKQSSIDVLCVDDVGRQYIVEMQVARFPGFDKRAQYYAAKTYARQLQQGDQYHQLKEIIFLAIIDFVMFPDKRAYKSDHVILDKETHSHDLKDFYFSFLELPKFNQSLDKLANVVEKWAYFFKHAEETSERDLEKIVGSDAVIKRAYEELNRFGWSEIELHTYEQEEKRERDAQAIIEQQRLDIAAERAAAEIEIKAARAAAEIEIKAVRAEVEADRAVAEIEIKAARAEMETDRAKIEAARAEIEAARAEIKAAKAAAETEMEAAKAKYIEQDLEKSGVNIAKRMLEQGANDTFILEITKITQETLDKIKQTRRDE